MPPPDVRRDVESVVRSGRPGAGALLTHTLEGDDDMPAHIKAALFRADPDAAGPPEGRLALGTWQGVYLCEQRGTAAGAGRWC